MKKMFTTVILIMLTLFLLCGCEKETKSEEEIKNDLASHSLFYMIEGSEVSDFHIIKRLNEEESKKDTVWVEVQLEHEKASEGRAYTMYYTNYEDGWKLDKVEPYEGEDAVWKVTPKKGPSSETIMEQLIEYSNEKIDECYSNGFYGKGMTDLYFFEEGKYLTTIMEGQMISDIDYSCLVETTRKFNYCEVIEEQILKFVFDTTTYKWNLLDGEIVKLTGKTYYEGEWETVEKEQVLFQCSGQYNNPLPRESFDGYCISENKEFDLSFYLDYPSSHGIDNGYLSFGDMVWDPASYEMFISPDEILCYNYKYKSGKWSNLQPVKLNGEPDNLNQTGWIEAESDSVEQEYKEIGYKVLEKLNLPEGVEAVKEFWYPYEDYSILYEIEEVLKENEISIIPLVYMGAELNSEDNSYIEDEIGTTVEENVVCYYKAKSSYDEDAEYWDIGVVMIKVNGEIKVLTIPLY